VQPTVRTPVTADWERAQVMEEVILDVRRDWFGARVVSLGRAVAVLEAGGEMVTAIDEDGPGADRLIAEAARRSAFVVATDFSRPADLGARLRRAGFAPVQRHATYILDETAFQSSRDPDPPVDRRTGLLHLLRRRERPAVAVHRISEAELHVWNGVCWRAFGARYSEAASLLDKQSAFRNMGADASWYLATVAGRPAGTAIIYQGDEAAQVLAVGTLPSLQGCGVATAIMRHLIVNWQQEGHGFLFLDTSPGSGAERLYLKLGFVPAYLREVYAPGRPIP